MTIEIKVPQLPESVTDATLVGWHKKVGESVRRDDNLVDLETDKVVLEVPAPASGTLIEIKVSDGTTVTSGELLALLDESAAPAAVERQQAEAPAPTAGTAEAAQKLSPAVRRLLDEHDLDATSVSGSGKDGRLTKSDVMAYLKSHSDEDVTPGDPAPALPAAGASRTEQRVPMTRLRARIAARMVEAQHAAAMLTTFNEVDLTKVMSLRKRYKESFEKEHGVRLGFMSFFAKAAVEALKKYPAVNASVEGNVIIYHDYFDIGIAVSSDRGLMVPVLRNVDHLSFAQIESDVAELGKKARDGTMSLEDLTGGTFTITNGGVFGSMLSTPILNPPQSAILGMHAIQQRPMVVDGEIVVRPMMYLALTYDHRIIDGKEAVQFLVNLKNSLEDPGRLLLQV
uniref:dihydrolipoyllysine-residue succinyltransferase n=1 Tax=uncultured marine microorganism TaxID=415540 RepID=A5CFW6_9ZZZZ|nr:2-oxoglutarate dehydrogenase [uncultured marine microorganism]